MHLTAEDSSPFLWSGTRVDVDGHLWGNDKCNGIGDGDDWGLRGHNLEEQEVLANAR